MKLDLSDWIKLATVAFSVLVSLISMNIKVQQHDTAIAALQVCSEDTKKALSESNIAGVANKKDIERLSSSIDIVNKNINTLIKLHLTNGEKRQTIE